MLSIPVYVLIIASAIFTSITLFSIIMMTVSQHKILITKQVIETEIQNFDIIYVSKKQNELWYKRYKAFKITAFIAIAVTLLFILAYSHLSTIAAENNITDFNNKSIHEVISTQTNTD